MTHIIVVFILHMYCTVKHLTVKWHNKGSNVEKYTGTYCYKTGFKSAIKVIDRAKNQTTNIIENWHTASTNQVDNKLEQNKYQSSG